MDSYLSLLYASVGGNIELLTLCFVGALLSYLGHWSGSTSAALSNGVYKIFFPALAFGAILDTIHRNIGSEDVADVWVPLLASVILSLLACLIAFPVTWVIASGKDELVKRALFMCLVLGNSNSMALLIMQSLCDSYQPLGNIPKCVTRSTTYSTLFILPVTVLTWTFVFPYLLQTPNELEGDALLHPVQHRPPPKKFSLLKGVRDSILCPPTITVLVATLVSFLPRVPEMLLKDGGILHPILMSANLVGTVAVPISSIIVGAELYESLTEESSLKRETEGTSSSSKRFGNSAIVVISVVRFIIYPFIGRLLQRLLGLNSYLNPLLRVFILTEWTVTSANNTIIMASIIAEMMPGRGERLRSDVAKCVFLQYLISPIFVTINTALALETTFQ